MSNSIPHSPSQDNEHAQLAQLRAELIDARERSLRANEAKTEFIANMSHELRTPMNAVIGMAEALWETELSGDQRKLLSVLMNGGKSLLRIINDVLELSRLEESKVDVVSGEFSLRAPIRNAFELFEAAAQKSGVKLLLIDSPLLDQTVVGDAQKIEQVLVNLIGNAVKFTAAGEVVVSVERQQCASKSPVTFKVEDSGIGMTEDQLKELFHRFSQADMSITKKFGGSGLGLAISKQLVEIMGGGISVGSQFGAGSKFQFSVHLPQASSANAPHASGLNKYDFDLLRDATVLDGLRVLVVEDSPDNVFLISTFLKNSGCDIEFATNGCEAIEKFESGVFDLILMDIQMPEMDGYAATRWIRLLESQLGRRTPIVALTAYAFAEQIRECIDAGCDGHLTKPFNRKSLIQTMVAYASS